MTEKVIGTVSAGSSPVYEVVKDEKFPWQIIIRLADNHSEQIHIARTAAPALRDILGRLGQGER